jgi:hypothetical protein
MIQKNKLKPTIVDMAKTNNSDPKLKFLQDTWKEGYSSIKKSTTEKQGFDTKLDKIELGNFKLIKGFLFGDYDLSIIDKDKDLDNKPISENKLAKSHLQALIRQGITEIHSKELHQFNLNTKLGKMTFENIIIYQIGLTQSYRIDLVDKEKGIENKIKDDKIDFKKVLNVIQKFDLNKKTLKDSSEVQLNKQLEDHFRQYFENAHRSSGNLRGAFDLELGKMNFVIEIKLASSLKKTGERDRASGQAKRYLQEFKKNNFLMLVIGENTDKVDRNIISIETEIKNDFKCYFHFLEAE